MCHPLSYKHGIYMPARHPSLCRSIYSGPQNPDKNGNLIPRRIFLPGIESGDWKFSVSRYAENEVGEGTESGRELSGAKIMEICQDEPVLS